MKLEFESPYLSTETEMDVAGLTLRGSDAGLEVQGRLSLRGGPRDAETAAELARFFQSLAGELAARPAPPEIEEAKGPPAAWMGKAFD